MASGVGAAALTVVLHGASPRRPSWSKGYGSASVRPSWNAATVGSRKARLSWTGPGRPPKPRAAPRTWATVDRHHLGASGWGSPGPSSRAIRTNRPKMSRWSMAWLAPTPLSSGGRSAETTTSDTPELSASTTAGTRFATAVPDVVTTAAGRPVAFAHPRAWKAAERSSITMLNSTPGWSDAAKTSAVERDPGDATTNPTPPRASSSTTIEARAVEGFG